MALPQKAIEQLGREPVRTPGWSGRILMFSSTILFVSVAIYFGLVFGYTRYITSQLGAVNDQIEAFIQKIPAAEQEKLINFYSQLVNLRTILGEQKEASLLLPWLERNTQANIYYTKLNLAIPKSQAALEGKAKSLEDLAQQTSAFQAASEVSGASISSASFNEKEEVWEFNATLTFNPAFFKGVVEAPPRPPAP